jgi:isopentenyl diphosphate isomerase/L-lactate dehydrogenase-like FMN-dependent dehydrogenase
MTSVLLRYFFTSGLPRQANLPEQMRSSMMHSPQVGATFRCDTLCWEEIRLLRRQWRGRFIIKGIVSPHDAAQAVQEGIDALIVSNHGGRNLDSVVATLDALPGVLDAVQDRVPVLLDSGIRRGSDVIKALALGAKAVLVGRASLYGLAVGGQVGVQRALDLLRQETARVMAFCGCRNIAEITEALIFKSK